VLQWASGSLTIFIVHFIQKKAPLYRVLFKEGGKAVL